MDSDLRSDRRTRKRWATRQAISDVATRLFMERGFDQVTIDEIANAADVGRMTVFNHFPRKEDMFFDREEEARALAFETVRSRPPGTSSIEALGALAHQMVEQPSEAFPLFEDTRVFVETAQASETLKARARQMRDHFVRDLAALLRQESTGGDDEDTAFLAAALITSAWSTAFLRAHAELGRTGDTQAAKRVFLKVVDQGVVGTLAALEATALGATG
ncbi:TetR/AcrR family transcriptional regulator [Sphingomonas yunnanensis]|uniref:TetR/AcrR family transcriptional regulator n=1 Tax=Sphingomonas yunnanensis TaxID=310400 RepID=UPI001CA78F81|nr:TetR/AcrR family transcriptional regulator [Sphingomonas yunnanensis]MBY9063355.1 TetR/AcrR family transcriptional regulator [Sphingomonas yunnanensis]